MSIQNNVSKMFNVLVVGGVMMASTGISAGEHDALDENPMLHEILAETGGEECEEGDDECEAEDDEGTWGDNDFCRSPQCNCWLG